MRNNQGICTIFFSILFDFIPHYFHLLSKKKISKNKESKKQLSKATNVRLNYIKDRKLEESNPADIEGVRLLFILSPTFPLLHVSRGYALGPYAYIVESDHMNFLLVRVKLISTTENM
jgi:hypothetical protein